MISRKLVRTDLNLLVALQVLLEECNVTRAAARLSVSQPAMSKTLQKLRDAFEDELFTRTAHGLVPTPKAEALGESLPALLSDIDGVLGEELFEPGSYEGRFRVLLPPMLGEALLPGLMAELGQLAPSLSIVTAEVGADYQEELKKGEADFVAYVATDLERDIVADPIAAREARCYMRIEHPLAGGAISLDDFLAYPHIRLYLSGLGRKSSSLIDQALERSSRVRRVHLETTQFAAAMGVLAHSDSLLVANAGFEESGLYRHQIAGVALPFELAEAMQESGGGGLSLLRHHRSLNSAAHQWMHGLLMKHLAGTPVEQETIQPVL